MSESTIERAQVFLDEFAKIGGPWVDGGLPALLAAFSTAENARLTAELREAVILLDWFTDTDTCRFGHNQNCQTHGTFQYDGTCRNTEAESFIKKSGLRCDSCHGTGTYYFGDDNSEECTQCLGTGWDPCDPEERLASRTEMPRA